MLEDMKNFAEGGPIDASFWVTKCETSEGVGNRMIGHFFELSLGRIVALFCKTGNIRGARVLIFGPWILGFRGWTETAPAQTANFG